MNITMNRNPAVIAANGWTSPHLHNGSPEEEINSIRPSTYVAQWGEYLDYQWQRRSDWDNARVADGIINTINGHLRQKCIPMNKVVAVGVDCQEDFVTGLLGGANLQQVSERKDAIAVTSLVTQYFKSKGALAVGTKDAHKETGDPTFAATYNVDPFTEITLPASKANGFAQNQKETVWPFHCGIKTSGQETPGANFYSKYTVKPHVTLLKGAAYGAERESYSAVFDVSGKQATPLLQICANNNTQAAIVGGLCTDFCPGHTAGHLSMMGQDVFFMAKGSAGVFANATENLEETAELLPQAKWRFNINKPETVYSFGEANKDTGYDPDPKLVRAARLINEGSRFPKFTMIKSDVE